MTAVLRAREVTKVYGGTHALKGVDFDVAAGRVTALFGENGAGKSTLMKILAGIERPTTGQVELDGEVTQPRSARDAADHGISIIHQELSLCPNLSVQDNLFLAREIRGRTGAVDRAAQRAATTAVMRRLEEPIDPDRLVADLRLGQQQIVEIARALLQNARVLIMDEPTSALTAPEVAVLFRLIRELTAAGVAVVYISHHLDEALEIADDVVVLRDGALVATAKARDVELSWIVSHMVGRDPDALFPDREPEIGEPVLALDGLVVADPQNPHRLAVDQLSLTLHEGEILGIYGLMGSGRTELLEAVAGRITPVAGTIELGGEPLGTTGIRDRIARGIALVPEDRQRDGLVQTMSVGQNISLAGLARFVRGLFVNRDTERAAVSKIISDVTVKTSGAAAAIGSLSGGNQQKVVIGKALLTQPRVLLLDEPSRGVDVGAKADIFALVAAQARRGLSVIFTTSEAEEALHIPDRLLVLARGRLVGEFRRGQITREDLMSLSDGGTAVPTEARERAR
ncbi:sugar ABC transporter ATP-binding protein [Phytohabitans suffuscus]|uniref:Sugar ABC transporter ATP-binding protein n=1 Tax=Phytohabitans suffuscus TaxID=624315 RepID=A0A6F8Z144_9ACTN|nr:sugar ABC transporter ATP-binding protein [Phytohabitans suffuscus]BCB92046.1 sugar ABC transporter ATP-binding protein [Phytohabitans suffuscus]